MRRPRGFSLIEVIVAFALLAVAMGILIAILGGGLGQVRQAGDASEATRKSATAAQPIKMSLLGACCMLLTYICSAVVTSIRVTPVGVASCTGPLISVTCAPISAAAVARAYPILPELWLLM